MRVVGEKCHDAPQVVKLVRVQKVVNSSSSYVLYEVNVVYLWDEHGEISTVLCRAPQEGGFPGWASSEPGFVLAPLTLAPC